MGQITPDKRGGLFKETAKGIVTAFAVVLLSACGTNVTKFPNEYKPTTEWVKSNTRARNNFVILKDPNGAYIENSDRTDFYEFLQTRDLITLLKSPNYKELIRDSSKFKLDDKNFWENDVFTLPKDRFDHLVLILKRSNIKDHTNRASIMEKEFQTKRLGILAKLYINNQEIYEKLEEWKLNLINLKDINLKLPENLNDEQRRGVGYYLIKLETSLKPDIYNKYVKGGLTELGFTKEGLLKDPNFNEPSIMKLLEVSSEQTELLGTLAKNAGLNSEGVKQLLSNSRIFLTEDDYRNFTNNKLLEEEKGLTTGTFIVCKPLEGESKEFVVIANINFSPNCPWHEVIHAMGLESSYTREFIEVTNEMAISQKSLGYPKFEAFMKYLLYKEQPNAVWGFDLPNGYSGILGVNREGDSRKYVRREDIPANITINGNSRNVSEEVLATFIEAINMQKDKSKFKLEEIPPQVIRILKKYFDIDKMFNQTVIVKNNSFNTTITLIDKKK